MLLQNGSTSQSNSSESNHSADAKDVDQQSLTQYYLTDDSNSTQDRKNMTQTTESQSPVPSISASDQTPRTVVPDETKDITTGE